MKSKAITNRLVLGWMLVFFLTAGFNPGQSFAQSESGTSAVTVEKIALMPFFKGLYGSRINETLSIPISQLSYNPQNMPRGSAKILTDLVSRSLQTRYDEKLISPSKVRETAAQTGHDETRDSIQTVALKTGKALGTPLIFAGNIWRYKERVGSAIGIQSPASVAFAIYLFDVRAGKMLWMSKFEETQRSLLENLLGIGAFFERGAKWLTARELASYGIKELIKKSPLEPQ